MDLLFKILLGCFVYSFVFELSIKYLSKAVRFLNLSLRQVALTLSTLLILLYFFSILVGSNGLLIIMIVVLIFSLVIIFGVVILEKVDPQVQDLPHDDSVKYDKDSFPGLEEAIRDKIHKEARSK